MTSVIAMKQEVSVPRSCFTFYKNMAVITNTVGVPKTFSHQMSGVRVARNSEVRMLLLFLVENRL